MLRYVSVICLLLVGCTSQVHLPYNNLSTQRVSNHIHLEIGSITDHRSQILDLGFKRSVLRIPIFTFVTEDSVPEWIRRSLAGELIQAGYFLANDSPYVIEAKVLKVITENYITYEGVVALEMTLKREDSIVFSRVYQITTKPGLNWNFSTKKCLNTLEESLRVICSKFITDLDFELL